MKGGVWLETKQSTDGARHCEPAQDSLERPGKAKPQEGRHEKKEEGGRTLKDKEYEPNSLKKRNKQNLFTCVSSNTPVPSLHHYNKQLP